MQVGATQLSPWAWVLFASVVAVLLAVDLVTTTGARAESRRWALGWSIVWIGTGLGFAGAVVWLQNLQKATEYLTVLLLEKSLSLDNLFVFLIIFGSLGIDKRYQHEVLFWGILGAIVLRGIFIFLGAAALERFDWVVYLFAAILLYAAWQAFRQDPAEQGESKVLNWLSKRLPVSTALHGGRFIAREHDHQVLTALAVALVAVEISDIMFAVDSIAAALSITRDTFVLYSANIFAILGLRALYMLLAHLIRDWPYLHYGIAAVLAFVAVKLLVQPWFHVPVWASLTFIVGIVSIAIVASETVKRQRVEKA